MTPLIFKDLDTLNGANCMRALLTHGTYHITYRSNQQKQRLNSEHVNTIFKFDRIDTQEIWSGFLLLISISEVDFLFFIFKKSARTEQLQNPSKQCDRWIRR